MTLNKINNLLLFVLGVLLSTTTLHASGTGDSDDEQQRLLQEARKKMLVVGGWELSRAELKRICRDLCLQVGKPAIPKQNQVATGLCEKIENAVNQANESNKRVTQVEKDIKKLKATDKRVTQVEEGIKELEATLGQRVSQVGKTANEASVNSEKAVNQANESNKRVTQVEKDIKKLKATLEAVLIFCLRSRRRHKGARSNIRPKSKPSRQNSKRSKGQLRKRKANSKFSTPKSNPSRPRHRWAKQRFC